MAGSHEDRVLSGCAAPTSSWVPVTESCARSCCASAWLMEDAFSVSSSLPFSARAASCILTGTNHSDNGTFTSSTKMWSRKASPGNLVLLGRRRTFPSCASVKSYITPCTSARCRPVTAAAPAALRHVPLPP